MPNALIEDVDKSIAAIDDLIETFQALLRISQIEAGARRERFAVVDLVEIMSRIEDAYSAVAEEKDQMLRFQVPIGPVTVNGDREILTQMLANTVENALRHCNAGAAITVSIAQRETGVLICVSDNGPGIPAPEYDKVFRRFYRLEKSRTTSGNGLGLSLIKAIAQLHEGHVSLSDNHPGLRVEIELP
jgi:signal transduction histidine kinase